MGLQQVPFRPMSLADRRGRLEWILDEAENAHEREWESEEKWNDYWVDLHAEASEHQKYLTNSVGMIEAVNEFEKLNTAETEALQAKQEEVGLWNTTGEWLNAIWRAQNKNFSHLPPDKRLVWWDGDKGPIAMKDMSEAIGADGGFLVPIQFTGDVMALDPEPTMFLSGATRIPMDTRQVALIALDQTGTVADKPHWFGGIQVFRQKEAGEKHIVDAKFREIDLVANEITAYARVSNTLLADSIISLAAFFNSPLGFNGAIQHRMDWECFNGSGAGEFLGVIPSNATITAPRALAGTIGYPDLLGMLQRFYAIGGQGIWFVTQAGLSTLAQISGPAGNPSYIWHTDGRDGLPGRLLGMPIAFTEKLPNLGVTGDVVLANRPFYLWGDRQAITVDTSTDERFRNNQTSFRAVARNDARPWLSDPFTLMDGTNQISPFVILGGGGS